MGAFSEIIQGPIGLH